MNAYKRYQKRKSKLKLAQAMITIEMARFQIYAVMSKTIFKGTDKERNKAKLQKSIEVAEIAIHTAQQISKIYAK